MSERAEPMGRSCRRVVLCFLLGLAAVEGAVASYRHVWRAYDPEEYRVKVRDCRLRPRDLVLVGGSPVSEGIDPAPLVGLPWRGVPIRSAYNLGLAGATTSDVWHAVEHGVTTPPRLMVYGATASDLNDARNEPNGPVALMTAGDVVTWTRLRPDAAEWCARRWAQARAARAWNLYHFRNGIRLWAAHHADRLAPGTFPEAAEEARDGLAFDGALRRGDGFAPRAAFRDGSLPHAREVGKVPSRFPYLERYHLGSHLRYLHRLADGAAEQGVPLVLLDMPVSAELEEMHADAFAAYRAALAGVAETHGLLLLDAGRDAVGLGDEHFADLIHLNGAGTERLSRWLRERLVLAGSVREGPGERGVLTPCWGVRDGIPRGTTR